MFGKDGFANTITSFRTISPTAASGVSQLGLALEDLPD